MRMILYERKERVLDEAVPAEDSLKRLQEVEQHPFTNTTMVAVIGDSNIATLCRPRRLFVVSQYL